jgi:hypothetical protein
MTPRSEQAVVVFCGPTVSADAVRARLVAECHGPVAQGDIVRAVANAPRAIGIIDGYFERVPSVGHKEILFALSRGIHVFGASSMGALRAAELDSFGMAGIGAIYRMFRDGELTDDDEVAVTHTTEEEGYRPLSTAMVDLRDLIARAEVEGVVTHDAARYVVEVAKSLHYRERSLPAVIALSRGRAVIDELRRLEEFAESAGPGAKETDALALVDHLAAFLASDPAPVETGWQLERTVFLDALLNEIDREVASSRIGSRPDPEFASRSGVAPRDTRQRALLGLLARREADRLGFGLSDEELESAISELRHSLGLLSAEETVAHLERVGLDWTDVIDRAADLALVEKLESVYRFEVEEALTRLLKLNSERADTTTGPDRAGL